MFYGTFLTNVVRNNKVNGKYWLIVWGSGYCCVCRAEADWETEGTAGISCEGHISSEGHISH